MTAYSVNLLGMLNTLEKDPNDKLNQSLLDKLKNKIDEYIIYTRNDGFKPDSNETSIIFANNFLMYLAKGYTSEVSASPTWYNFLNSYFEEAINDNIPPTISSPK